ncbi:MAG TPA: DoxX family protein [Propionibacteriaceae bacterium]|nr:DoxX family protein [Propionibacteriaceae bacterium]
MSDHRPEPVESEPTQILDPEAERAEREAAAARSREEARAARDRSLGKVNAPAQPVAAPPVVVRRTTDTFLGALGLFVLRLVTAAVLGVRGYQHLTGIPAFTDFITRAVLPYPHYLAWGIAIAEVVGAVSLVFGLLTRVTGIVMAILMVGALARVMWGAVSPFHAGVAGFTGELELVLAAVGVLFFCLGAGRWSVDGSVRAGRDKARASY